MAKDKKAILAALKTAVNKKQADLDILDDQIMGMPPTAPEADFDLLSQKRTELEDEIRKNQELIALFQKWDELKAGDWSPEIKQQLSDMDSSLASIGEGTMGMDPMAMGDPMGAPAPAVDPLAAPAPAPMDAGIPASPEVAPPVPEISAEPAPAPEAAIAPVASAKRSASNKVNYQVQEKKGHSATSTTKEGSHMASNQSLQAKVADVKASREAASKVAADIHKEAQTRIGLAYTVAKTMLPAGAPHTKIQALASSLLAGNDTTTLKALTRQAAINSHYTHVAETFKEVHKVELNDLLEDPSVLNSERKSVESEMNASPKSAAAEKKADDRKDAGPQTPTYNDGRGHGGGPKSEPKEMDGGHAGDRPADTVNKSEEGDKTLKAAAAEVKVAHGKGCECPECKAEKKAAAAAPKVAEHKCSGADCATCKAAGSKKADEMPPMDAPAGDAGAPPMDAAPAGDMPPAPEGDASAAPPVEGGEPQVLTEEKKMDMQEKIDEAAAAVQALSEQLNDEAEEEVQFNENELGLGDEMGGDELGGEPGAEGGEELDLQGIFDQGEMDDKVSALANEGEEHEAGMDDASFFGPSASSELEAGLEQEAGLDMADMFAVDAADADPMAFLINGTYGKEGTANIDGFEVLESFTGELSEKLNNKETDKDDRDSESDHAGALWAEVIEAIEPENQGAKRTKQDATNELQEPKSAAKAAPKKSGVAAIPKIKAAAGSPVSVNIAAALFGDDDKF